MSKPVKKFLGGALFLGLMSLGAPAVAATWLLGAAACPPWKAIPGKPELTRNMAQACANDIALFVDGFKATYGVADDHIITLVDKQATTKGVTEAMQELARKAAPDDRVILYVNTHGGAIEAMYEGYQVKDEIFAWYTTEKPRDMEEATANGDWMTVRAFRDLVNGIQSHEIVTVIEACHAAAGLNDYIDNVRNGIGERGDSWPGREAVIFSAGQGQIANFTAKGDQALFTRKLSEALKLGSYDTLANSFQAARLATHRTERDNCKKGHDLKELITGWDRYRQFCTQMPTVWDPFGLLDDIRPAVTGYGTEHLGSKTH